MNPKSQAGQTPPLNDAEQNIGNSFKLLPQEGTVGTVIPQVSATRPVNLSGGSARGQTISVVYTASRIVGADNPRPGYAGPVTGLVEFGNGGRSTRAEFDVPVGPYVGNLQQAGSAIQPQDGGVIVTVPSSIIRAYFRYDNLLLAPVLETSPPKSLAEIQGVKVTGPGGPRNVNFPPPLNVIYPEPVLVQAMASYFTKSRQKVYKTLYLYTSDNFPNVSITVDSDGGGKEVPYCLPAFCKSVKVLRLPLTAALDVWLWDGIDRVDQYTIAAGTSAPEIEVRGNENIISIRSNTLHGDKVNFLALACEIGI